MQPTNTLCALDDDALLERLQRAAFDYFVQTMNPQNGLIPDTSRDNSPVSIAVVGFALSAYPAAVDRGWIDRAEAVRRSLLALHFFADSDQSGSPTATGYKGFYYHFLDIHSGQRVWQSELSMIDSALLIAGMLTAASYFQADNAAEAELRELVDALYRRVDWCWSQDGGDTIRQGWKPECGYLHYGWEGYSEAIVLYALAMGSPTHPVSADCYAGWVATYQWENLYGQDFLYAGPLFVHQFSQAWVDLRGIRDAFMREKCSDYFENSQRAVHVQRCYTQLNPQEFVGYDRNCWGLSACDGPTDEQVDVANEQRRLFGYAARGVPYGPDDGTLSPPAVLASLPFAPEAALAALRNMLARYPEILGNDRLATSFNASVSDKNGRPWVSAGHYGLDQGIVFMMIENHRSGSIWQRLQHCEPLVRGLRRAGFAGGWLDASIREAAQ
ncbi:glucoamylase family protein [Rhodanobacter sp. AS-Z3]|uniref:glucoamylase family protein n=1 Tax=Rhodanobacter sp. AS-Z3 TaxID=3031330 RepID=UPI00247A9556|nr:glucoamylase family protein [Rhodanobacter sp. AS-Z3]WEN15601.1 glucoamylase family protein [Rhodanobacter sp. AS-Z3]